MPPDEEEKEAALSTDDSEQEASTEGEPKVEEKAEEAAAEEEKEEEKAEEVTLPELTDEQRAVLAKDPAMQGLVRGAGAADLDAFIKSTLDEHDQTKEREQTQAAEQKTLDEAEKAYREDNDPGPLAQIAAESLAKSRQRADVSVQVEAAAYEQVRPFVEAEYGDIVRALKPEEVKALDAMPLVDALKDLAHRKVEAVKGESAGEVDSAKKMASNAETAAKARSEGGGSLPAGSAKEAVGSNIGDLMRQGFEDATDSEELAGG